MSAPRLVVFDLDGTLVDSLADIGGAMNALLAEIGLPARPLADYGRIAGDGARVAIQRATDGRFDEDPARIDTLTERYLEIYRRRGSPESRPYDGVPEALEIIGTRASMGVLTNKPHDIALDLVEGVFGLARFVATEGVRQGRVRKPDPGGLLHIADVAGCALDDVAYVGDTNTDVRTARAAGVRMVGCAWGFRARAELEREGAYIVIDAPRELPGALGVVD